MKRVIPLIAIVWLMSSSVWADCDSGYSIQTKSEDGSLITLNDGSTWRVVGGGQTEASIWVDGDEILVCDDDTFINKDEENEQVDVELLSR